MDDAEGTRHALETRERLETAGLLVSERGRVIARVERTAQAALARIWVKRDVQLDPGALVAADLMTAVGAVARGAVR